MYSRRQGRIETSKIEEKVPSDMPHATNSPMKEVEVLPREKASSTENAAPSGGVSSTVPKGGFVVFVDPQTRQIREPSPEEMRALTSSPQARFSTQVAPEPTMIQGPGGTVGILLGPEFHSYVVVNKTPEGGLSVEEVTGEKAAQERVLASDPKASIEK